MGDYLRPYEKALEKHGASFEATLWRSREKQCVRFGVIRALVDFAGRTVLDAGSGLGDFSASLAEHQARHESYVGLEALASFVDASNARGLPRSRFVECDFVREEGAFAGRFPQSPDGRADIVLFCGSLNTLEQDLAMPVLERAWDACRVALVFNFLSERYPEADCAPADSIVQRYCPGRVLEWALDRTPLVTLRHDYMEGHDATVALYREPEAVPAGPLS